jgi:hypothetical protein
MNYIELLNRLATLRRQGKVSFFKLIEELREEKEHAVALLSQVLCETEIDLKQIEAIKGNYLESIVSTMMLQMEAMDVLANIDVLKAQEFVPDMLLSHDKSIRWCVCGFLGEYPFPDSEAILLAHLPIEPHEDARGAALRSLATRGTSKSLEILHKFAQDDHIFI